MTNNVLYDEPLKDYSYGDLFTVEDFKVLCEEEQLIDYDGDGHAVKGKLICSTLVISPTTLDCIPDDATHIVWFNR